MAKKYYSIYKDGKLYANIQISRDYFVEGYLDDNQYYLSGYLDFNNNLNVYIVKDAFNNYCNAFQIQNFKSKQPKLHDIHSSEELEPISSSTVDAKLKIKQVKSIDHFDEILDNSLKMLFDCENKLLYKIKVQKMWLLKKYFSNFSECDVKERQIKKLKKSLKK